MKRTRGFPTSPNRASSFHLWWQPPAEYAEVEVTLEVVEPPVAPSLYFWALQAAFEEEGRSLGAAHLGLQWHPEYPNGTAVNFGGYSSDGNELVGTGSHLVSSLGNANTRDFDWAPAVGYRLRIFPGSQGGSWSGSVTDLRTGSTTEVRELHGGGVGLGSIVMWSEVFARCDDPPVVVRWSDPVARVRGGEPATPSHYLVTFQPASRGGCSNTNVRVVAAGVEQVTNHPRSISDSSSIPISLQGNPHRSRYP